MLISLGILNKKLLIPFVFPIFIKVRRFIRDEEYKIIENPFFKIFNTFLSFTICGFIYLIVLYKLKKEKESKNENDKKNDETRTLSNSFLMIKNSSGYEKESINLSIKEEDIENNPIQEEQEEYKKIEFRKKLFFILLITLFQLIPLSIKDIWRKHSDLNMDYRQTIAVFFELLFLLIFSILFLNFQIYFHQIFSLSIIFLCLLIFLFGTIFFNHDNIKYVFKHICFFASCQIFFCLDNVLGKKYLNIYFDNIYLFLFKIGILGLIPILFYDIIVEIFFNDSNGNYHGIIIYFRELFKIPKKIHLFLLDLIFGTIYEVSLWLTIYYFSPLHFIILEVLGEFIETSFNIIKPEWQNKDEYPNKEIIIYYTLYPIVIFCVLVFNEIIILNFCGLNYNTRKGIMIRQKIDGVFEIDKSGNFIPISNESQSSLIEVEKDEDHNNPIFE